MNLYSLALFAHVIGAMGIFMGIGTWALALAGLRRAHRVEQVRILAGVMRASGNVAVGGIALLGVAGCYMALTAWGVQATWIVVASISFALLAPFGAVGIDPRLRRIAAESEKEPDGPLPASLQTHTHDPLLAAGLALYLSCLAGIVFLMTNKPRLVESLLTMGVALAVGSIGSLVLVLSAHLKARRRYA